jgi:uncharacterized protein involved in cysteine biosynthesis
VIRPVLGGLRSVLDALGLVRQRPRLLLFLMMAPWTLNLIIFLGSWSLLTLYFTGHMGAYLDTVVDAWWNPLLTGFGYFVAVIVAGALAYIITIVGAVVVAAPFYDNLSAQAERLAFPERAATAGRLGILAAYREGLKTALALLVLEAALFLLLLVPVAGPPLFALGSAYVLTMGLLDVPLARRELTLRQRTRFVAKNAWGVLGIALAVLAVSGIPFVNLLAVPLLVVAATLLVGQAGTTA